MKSRCSIVDGSADSGLASMYSATQTPVNTNPDQTAQFNPDQPWSLVKQCDWDWDRDWYHPKQWMETKTIIQRCRMPKQHSVHKVQGISNKFRSDAPPAALNDSPLCWQRGHLLTFQLKIYATKMCRIPFSKGIPLLLPNCAADGYFISYSLDGSRLLPRAESSTWAPAIFQLT